MLPQTLATRITRSQSSPLNINLRTSFAHLKQTLAIFDSYSWKNNTFCSNKDNSIALKYDDTNNQVILFSSEHKQTFNDIVLNLNHEARKAPQSPPKASPTKGGKRIKKYLNFETKHVKITTTTITAFKCGHNVNTKEQALSLANKMTTIGTPMTMLQVSEDTHQNCQKFSFKLCFQCHNEMSHRIHFGNHTTTRSISQSQDAFCYYPSLNFQF